MIIIGNGLLLCPDKIIDDGAVLIIDNKIADIGASAAIKKKNPNAKFIDAKGGIIMPGLMNCHMHLYSTFARGLNVQGPPAKNFIEILNKLWWRLDKKLTKEDVYYSALAPLIECIREGTTTVIDHHASPNFVKGSLSTIAEALKVVPVRASLCYEVSDRDGGAIAAAGIDENIDFIKNNNGDMLKGLFGLHASFTVSQKTLKKCVDAASKLKTGFHVHTAEDKADVVDSKKQYGMGVVERWNRESVLGKKTLLAHCVHISKKEMELLAQTGTSVVHNPSSNMNNAVGAADVAGMLKKGVLVGLGTDGMTSDMFSEAKFAHLTANHAMVFKNNYKILENLFGWKAGRIEKGALADIIICDYKSPTPITRDNFFGHFLYGMSSGVVSATIINGRVLMQDRKLVGIDEEGILKESRRCAQKFWERF